MLVEESKRPTHPPPFLSRVPSLPCSRFLLFLPFASFLLAGDLCLGFWRYLQSVLRSLRSPSSPHIFPGVPRLAPVHLSACTPCLTYLLGQTLRPPPPPKSAGEHHPHHHLSQPAQARMPAPKTGKPRSLYHQAGFPPCAAEGGWQQEERREGTRLGNLQVPNLIRGTEFNLLTYTYLRYLGIHALSHSPSGSRVAFLPFAFHRSLFAPATARHLPSIEPRSEPAVRRHSLVGTSPSRNRCKAPLPPHNHTQATKQPASLV